MMEMYIQAEQAYNSLLAPKTQTIQVYFSTELSLFLCVQKLKPPKKQADTFIIQPHYMPFCKS